MNPCELTASITALANTVANKLSAEQLELTAAIVTQFGDTLTTIAARRNFCANLNEKKASAHKSFF